MESKKRFTSGWGQAARGSIENSWSWSKEAEEQGVGGSVKAQKQEQVEHVGAEEVMGIEVVLMVKCTLFFEEFSWRGKEKKWDGGLRSSQVERIFAWFMV